MEKIEKTILEKLVKFNNVLQVELANGHYRYLKSKNCGDESECTPMNELYDENQYLRIPYFLMKYFLRNKDKVSFKKYNSLCQISIEDMLLNYLTEKYGIEDTSDDSFDDYSDSDFSTAEQLIAYIYDIDTEITCLYEDNGIELEDESMDNLDYDYFIDKLACLMQYSREYTDLQVIHIDFKHYHNDEDKLILEQAIKNTILKTSFEDLILELIK